ncbi:helix-turn-helix domain-containing protein [Paenibacillus thalictri]|uniref:XRE family transcriptional regulator n=1 Tax=Paenibacillus thalictri TaxID=2527873 RepID=A0A4Q9DGU2_9BACL|nr:helix-turn-helix transcriptional regulator [Paenibacillus thalictri]TBL69790.1 XRE family transcriptional regulator [Paenibacillus thalictri]
MFDFKKMVGERIRSIRKTRGLTQERLAELSGLSFTYISDVERSSRNISLESLGRIIIALGIKPAQLFENTEDVEDHSGADVTRTKIESLNALLANRPVEDVDFIIKMTQEFTNTVDRRIRSQ